MTAEHIESLKQEYVEYTISLAESFAQKAARYAKEGDERDAVRAQSNAAAFARNAVDMIQKLRDREKAEAFLARLILLGCDPQTTEYVA